MKAARDIQIDEAPAESPDTPVVQPAITLWYVRTAFRQQIGNVTVSFSPGQLITDEVLAANLMAMGCPLVAVKDPDQIITCPHCRRAVTLDHALEAERQ